MGVMDNNPKKDPMHYGEVMGSWSFVAANNGLISGYETFVNHVGDKDLKRLLIQVIEMMQSHNTEVVELLKNNGIVPPPALPSRPKATTEDIPVGARFEDIEISATVAVNVGQGLVSCSQVMGQCLREDIAKMFGKFHTEWALFGAKLLKLNKEKGWIVPPPLHTDVPE
ncbi:DUF3231 family protein [Viridibacillus arvi]|uniref:DUF3231 family protein n=1 Tax=Viridibacillus arvi TaxID=263475 RepID=UPI003D019FB1